ncbi:MAG: hypothetical protein M1823_000475 [Watsoniomyces obsoletus]|nr:MAG: hypothetical protein M1823_000475 [Watsoniomyces obsoletus]
MSVYEIEHNIPSTNTPSSPPDQPHHPSRLPDLASFFSSLNQIDTSSTHNPHAIPTPGDAEIPYILLAEAFRMMILRQSGDGVEGIRRALENENINDNNARRGVGRGGGVQQRDDEDEDDDDEDEDEDEEDEEDEEDQEGYIQTITSLIEELLREADSPPRRVLGFSQEDFDRLERVPKKKLNKSDTCPICNTSFLEDPYPPVVRLPCHKSHLFDLECITPWLKLHSTCPLDRKELLSTKKSPAGGTTGRRSGEERGRDQGTRTEDVDDETEEDLVNGLYA